MSGWLSLIVGLLVLVALAAIAIVLLRRSGIATRQGKRITILEKLPFGRDGHFVLVRRDGVEHFVFIGEGGGFLVEANIRRRQRTEPAATPAAPPPSPAPQPAQPQPMQAPVAPHSQPPQPAAAPQPAPQPPRPTPATAPQAPRPAPATAPPAPRTPPSPGEAPTPPPAKE